MVGRIRMVTVRHAIRTCKIPSSPHFSEFNLCSAQDYSRMYAQSAALSTQRTDQTVSLSLARLP